MQALSGDETVLDQAKRLAKRALDETGHGSQVAILFAPGQADEPVRWSAPPEAKRTLDAATPSHRAGDLAAPIHKAAQSLGRFGSDFQKIIHVVSDLQLSAIEALGDLTLPPNVTLRVAKAGELEPVNGGSRSAPVAVACCEPACTGTRGQAAWITVEDELHGEAEAGRLAKREVDLAGGQTSLAVPYTAGNRYGWVARTLTTPGGDAWPGTTTAHSMPFTFSNRYRCC